MVPQRGSADALQQRRVVAFQTWENVPKVLKLIGSGKYGTVYSVGDAYVLKRSFTSSQRRCMCKQALREHTIGLLQTITVLEGCIPHLPMHYGVSITARGSLMEGEMYMEQFTGSLIDAGAACLCESSDWLCLAFSVLSSCAALALLYEISHNDLYPRNVLLRRDTQATSVVYSCDGVLYDIAWPFLAVVTDFGVATSTKLMGKRLAPEVADRMSSLQASPDFGQIAPEQHILKYNNLPYYSRDVYTVLKWMHFQSSTLPPLPQAVQQWAGISLQMLDKSRDTLHTAAGLMRYFHSIFSTEWLGSCGLSPLRACGDINRDCAHFIFPPSDEKMTQIMLTATKALLGIPLKSCLPGEET